jgi:pyruvate dehydrogenase phosphatase
MMMTVACPGHLGEDTVEHTAYHLPIIIEDFLRKETSPQTGRPRGGAPAVADVLRRAISSFDAAIAGDILNLFPGGLDGLAAISDAQIAAVLNDDGPNFKKARLCLYGTTALLALVDPTHENLWCANLGDCQAGT